VQTFWSPTTILFKDNIFSTAFIVWSFAVGDQKVCIFLIGPFKALKQTFWNTKQRRKHPFKPQRHKHTKKIDLKIEGFVPLSLSG